ncbi:MAG: NAD(P)-dependent oxidoreductase [Lachnospiraceae bacterium]|nr:NAD(P)-dependent oxidoreductase [Lachnospiraceae bacterium]
MKITVLQEKIAQPDLRADELTAHWNRLKSVPGVSEVNIIRDKEYPSVQVLSDWIGDSDAVFGIWVGPNVINRFFLSAHPNLQYISMLGHGYEPFDKEYARNHGVTITNTIYGASTIAEYAFALLNEVCHRISVQNSFIQDGDWTSATEAQYCRAIVPQIELYGKTIGIIGLGAIGFHAAQIARGYGMHVIGLSRHKKRGEEYSFIEQTSSLEYLLSHSDVISLHVPHTKETENMISGKAISHMKKDAILINTARGAVVDEKALADALRSGRIRAAAVDVLREEPPQHGSPLLGLPNCIVTGHIAWLTRESRFRAIDMAIDQFRQYLDGYPVSVID